MSHLRGLRSRQNGGQHDLARFVPKGGGGATTLVTDTFTRASDTFTLGVADSGQTWANFGAAARWTITSGQANPAQSGAANSGTVLPAGNANVTMTVTDNFTTGIPGFVLRWQDATNYLLWYYTSTTNMRLSKFVAGVETALGNDTVTAPSTALTYVMSLDAANLITLKRGGVTIRTITDATFSAATSFGFGGAVTTADLLDNLTITSP